jgi:nonsense-mediated mRNA decay protein 3
MTAAMPDRVPCVQCGRAAPRLVGGLCAECFVAREPLLEAPPTLVVEVCAHCDARHVGAHWFDPAEADDLADVREAAARAAVKVHPRVEGALLRFEESQQDERTFPTRVDLEGEVEGVAVRSETTVQVRMRRSVCDRCSRMFGGFYAAILQLRATDRAASKSEVERAHAVVGAELDRLRAAGNREAFLTKSGPVPGGFDYYIGDIEAGRIVSRAVAERLGAQVLESAKLVGRKEGNDLHRVTFLIRIALYANGDFARLGEDRLVQVTSLDRGRAMVVDLETHRRDKVDTEGLRRLGGPEMLQDAVLVSQDEAHLQLLDPVSLATVDVVRPEGFQATGPTVPVVRHEERLYLVP